MEIKKEWFEPCASVGLQCLRTVAYPGIFFGGGFQQIQLRTEDTEDGDLGAVAP